MRGIQLAMVLACSSCASRPPHLAEAPSIELVGGGGESVDLLRAARAARLTVLVFFSADCHCLDAHGARLRALYDEYQPQRVQFFMIDSEVTASVERDQVEARRRGYPFPILLDRAARLAGSLSAEYATYSVVLDAGGRVRYAGGIDSDKTHLRGDATPYLKNAIDDLLDGRSPRVGSAEALGCALERW
ncbi:MAG TPA: redoxin domain-containing protein [Polyangiaceae bacterium]|nr:redoxin domain-containing protein [Polyangiaceae bacterium]